MNDLDALQARAKVLNLNGLLAHWTQVATESWVQTLIDWEEQERARRSLERRLREARIGRFKPICEFDWNWPKRCDRSAFDALMSLDFLKDAYQRRPGRSKRRRKINAGPQHRPSSADPRPYRAVHQRRPTAR